MSDFQTFFLQQSQPHHPPRPCEFRFHRAGSQLKISLQIQNILPAAKFKDNEQSTHIRRHGEGDLVGETAGLGEHVEVPAGEGEGDWLLHLDSDGLLLLVHVGRLGQLDVADTDVTGRGELDALLKDSLFLKFKRFRGFWSLFIF